MFKYFNALIENQTGKIIKVFRYYNGGKFSLNVFIGFSKNVGIEKDTIVPYKH